ncbi:MAG: DUF3187 family protein [Proteobacteria bacterium]|nr:DUF3187 family protein [Pseudomonadota bacterium]
MFLRKIFQINRNILTILLPGLIISFTNLPLMANSRQMLDKPMIVGPQYPLLFLSTTFEPDTAFSLKSGEFFFSTSYTLLNAYVYSDNSKKAEDRNASASEFDETDSKGYSVYFDGEMDYRYFKAYYGISDWFNFQFTYRDFRYFGGTIDDTIENFHDSFNFSNKERHQTGQDLLEIYIYDNELKENVFIVTEESPSFLQQSMTLGVKVRVKETSSEAISFSFSSNFGDYYIEQEFNEATSDAEDKEFKNFNDYNFSLFYSSLFESSSLHAAFAVSFVDDSLLRKSPKTIYYFFLGGNWFLTDNWIVTLQLLEYTSPFPKDKSNIAEDIREVTAGLRWHITDNSTIEFGFTENQTQGPQNIDITFFSNLMLYL